MPNVFLSYARADYPIVARISEDLRGQGVSTWIDRDDLVGGQAWRPQIERALSGADFLLVFFSKASLESTWVEHEYSKAFESQSRTGGTRVIPILLEKVSLPEVIATIQYVDFTGSYFEGMTQLLRAIHVAQGPRPRDFVPVSDLAKELAGEVAKLLGLERIPAAQGIETVASKNVFVIMPSHADMEPIFEGIQDAGRPLGLDVQRVENLPGDYKISDQIIKMIHSAKLVVADLTHERPNVYFELGYARGLGKTVVTIARAGTIIHFDVQDWTYLAYTDSRILERDLKKRFEFELSRLISPAPKIA
jgi:hypothetical protein